LFEKSLADDEGESMNMSDSSLADAVTQELEWDARIGQNTIEVHADRGVVVLLGAVGSWAKRLAAQEAAERVAFVRELSNRLEVDLPRKDWCSDAELVQSVRNALDWDVFLCKADIGSSASAGLVILEGQVDVYSQRDDAERAIRHIRGIRGVLNRISVRPASDADLDIQKQLEAALERRAGRERHRIDLDVHDGKVILSGIVRSLAERKSIVDAAKGTRGIRAVDDRLTIEPSGKPSRGV